MMSLTVLLKDGLAGCVNWYVIRDSENKETVWLGTNKEDAAFYLRRWLREHPGVILRDKYNLWSSARYRKMLAGRTA